MKRQSLIKPLALATAFVSLLINPLSLQSQTSDQNTLATASPKALHLPGVQNVFRVTEKIYSGSQPENDEAFAAIAKLGIKIIVSVDGSRPDLESARKHGLRYVHLPFGYDGIPTDRVAQLAKLSIGQTKPIFVHCHQGLHRGPAAVAVMCEVSAGWTTNRAIQWLHIAGTSADYPGLFRAVNNFTLPSKDDLASVEELPETTEPTSLVVTMLAIDELYSAIKRHQQNGWKEASDKPLKDKVTLLSEQLKEMTRTEDTAKQPEDYRTKLSDSLNASSELKQVLTQTADAKSSAFKILSQSCVACHREYRNQ